MIQANTPAIEGLEEHQISFQDFVKIYRSSNKLEVREDERIELQILGIMMERLKSGKERTEEKDVKVRVNGGEVKLLNKVVAELGEFNRETSEVQDILTKLGHRYPT